MPGFETTETIDNADLRHLAEQVAFDAQVSIDRGQYDITPEDDDTGPSAEQEEPTADTAPASILSETVEMAATDEEAAEPAPPADPGGTVPPGNVPPTPPGGSDEAEPNEPYEKDGDKPAAVSPTIIIDAKKTENFGEDLSELLSQAGGNTGDRSAYEVHRINPGDTDMSFEALLRKYVDSVGTGAIGANEYEYTSVDEDPAEREALNHLFAPDIKGDSTPVADGNESADAPADDEPAFEIFPIAQGDRDLPFDEIVNKYIDPEAAPNYATDDSPAPGAVKPVFAVYFEEGPVGSDAETLDASQLTAQVAAEGLLAEWGVAEGDIPLLDEQTEQADAGEPQESRPADTIESTTEPTAIAPDQQAGLYQIGQDASSSPAASTAEATPNAPA
ncbi:MAG TPA: hypothetical protein VGO07_07755, partial [Candidatus Saccharimonadales bacterium]|nr:hypothetical protein [Candidatus Saccharimonadales bacterium]